LSEFSEPRGRTAINVAELLRLNAEVKKLREDIAEKRRTLQGIASDRRAKTPFVDLNEETRKLNGILVGLAKVAEWLKIATMARAGPDRSSTQLDLVQEALLKIRNDLESEKRMREEKIAKLVEELTLQHEAVKMLRDEVVRALGSIEREGTRSDERRAIEPSSGKERSEIGEPRVLSYGADLQKVTTEDRERKKVEATEMKLQALRKELQSERKALQVLRASVNQDKRGVAAKRKVLERALKRIDREKKAIRDEEKRLRQRRLAISMMKSEQERKNLEAEQKLEKDREEVDRREDITLKIRDELRCELNQLIDLAKYLLEVKKENEREHTRLRNEQDKLAKAISNLEREKGRLANRLLQPRTEKRHRSSSQASNMKKRAGRRPKKASGKKK